MKGHEVDMALMQTIALHQEPYPHLRDNSGAVLAADYVSEQKLAYVVAAARACAAAGIADPTTATTVLDAQARVEKALALMDGAPDHPLNGRLLTILQGGGL